MRTAVYNRFWASRGGGERYAGMIASTLAADGHEVDLIGPEPVDIDALSTHLSLDLGGVRSRVVAGHDESSASEVSAEYDLFVTSTYMSRLRPRSKRSAYVCFFPTPPDHELSPAQRAIARRVGGQLKPVIRSRGYGFGTGWYPPEGGLRRQWSWSNGDGYLELASGESYTMTLTLGNPGGSGLIPVTVCDQNGTELVDSQIAPEFADIEIDVPASESPRLLRITSQVRSPEGDSRQLGVALAREGFRHRFTPSRVLLSRYPWLRTPFADDRSYLPEYDSIVTISQYTKDWVSKLWHTDSDLLFPPIDVAKMDPSPTRDKTIITVGRFFDPRRGHGKRQLEMVEIFRELVDQRGLSGWTLHMVGGCEEANRPYYEKVMAASEGLPIELHPNAPRPVLNRLINRASIFWSATGMNEDTERYPWRNEHFGMTTAEAMAAGCVPVVIDRAGQQEIVRDGIDGYRWSDQTQAVDLTLRVVRDDELRATFAASAIERAADFSDDAFARRWREICVERDLLSG